MDNTVPTEFQGLFAEMMGHADEDIDLARAALYISGTAYPDLDVEYYVKVLDALAEMAGEYVHEERDLRDQVQRLGEFLFLHQGFRGNDEDYDDPQNSYLNQVMDRRKGIPITLSLLYMEVARRLGTVFEGIGLPGHFVVRTGPPEDELYVDAFNGGNIMSRDDCQRRVQELFQGKVEFQEEHLRPYTKKELLVRILTNLKHNYFKVKDYRQAIVFADLIAVADPSRGSNLKERAGFYHALKLYRMAIRDLEAYLNLTPPPEDSEEVRGQVLAIWATVAKLN